MPPVLHVMPQDVDTNEKRQKYSVAVVGCGHKGIFYANAFAEAGFNIICTDADASVIKKVAKGRTAFANPEAETELKRHIRTERISVVSELKKAVSQSDNVVIAITAKVDEQKKNDYTGLVNTCKQVGAALHQGALVIYGGIAGLGFTEGTIKGLLEDTSGFKVGQDLGLAYSPLLTTNFSMTNLELRVAAPDKISLEAAAIILKTLTSKVQEISDLRTAETATLFEVAKHDTDMGSLTSWHCLPKRQHRLLQGSRRPNLNTPSFRPTAVEG